MPKCPNCERETKRTTDWACQWCGYPLLSGSFKMIPKTFQQLKDEAWQKAKPEREPDSGAGPEGGLETAMEAELIVEPAAEPAKDREPTPEPAAEPTPEPIAKPSPPPDAEPAPKLKAEPAVAPKPAKGPEPVPKASVIPLGEPHREQLPKPEKAAEPQPGPEPEAEPIKQPEPEPTPQPEPAAEPQPEPVPAPKPIKKLEPVAEELTVDELIEAYEQDAPAADARFVDKRLMVTGVVALIDVKETLDTHYIRLAGAEGDTSRSVKCLFDKKHAPDLSQLEKGKTATVQGKFNGSLIAIRMIDCELG